MKSTGKQIDITLAGIGIGGFERTTLETIAAFKRARIILHLTSYHQRLKRYCKHVVSLEREYWTGEEDVTVYKRIADSILREAKNGPGVVVVDDGHPAFYDDVTWDVYRRGRQRGLRVQILPAVSCLDAMMAKCGLEISGTGFQIFEATALVGGRIAVNPSVDALIMQVGWFGSSLLLSFSGSKKGRFKPLVRHLTRFYPKTHKIRILQAPATRKETSIARETSLSLLDLGYKNIPPSACLFVPALKNGRGAGSSLDENFIASTVDRQHVMRITR